MTKIKFKKSSILDKLPTDIELGELAINFNHEKPFLSTLDSSGEIATFPSSKSVGKMIEEKTKDAGKVQDVIVNGASVVTDKIATITIEKYDDSNIKKSIAVVSGKVGDLSAEIDAVRDESIVYTDGKVETLQKELIDDELVVSQAISTIQSSTGLDEHLKYQPDTSNKILSGATSFYDADIVLAEYLHNNLDGIETILKEINGEGE